MMIYPGGGCLVVSIKIEQKRMNNHYGLHISTQIKETCNNNEMGVSSHHRFSSCGEISGAARHFYHRSKFV